MNGIISPTRSQKTKYIISQKTKYIISKKEKSWGSYIFCHSGNNRMKKESEKLYKYLHLARELNTLRKMRLMVIPIVVGALRRVLKESEKRVEELEIWWRIKTIQTTEILRSARILHYWEVSPSLGDLRRLAVTQISMKDYQLTLEWKTRKKKNNNKARWIENIKDTYRNNEPQMYEDFKVKEIINILKHAHKWKSAGIDKVTTGPLAEWVECSPIVKETGVQSLIEPYQRLKKNGTWCRLA